MATQTDNWEQPYTKRTLSGESLVVESGHCIRCNQIQNRNPVIQKKTRQPHELGTFILAYSSCSPKSAPPRRGLCKRGFCRHEFIKVCAEGVQVTHAQGQGVSL